jgi:transmembrane sensor
MTDGSMITLNTYSQVRVEVSEAERRVNLDRGEAFFEVAHDVRRPFIVHAGDKLVTAVGTNFSVSRDSHDAVRVVVSEGKVRVDEVRSLHPHSAQVSAGSVALAGSGSIAVEERSMPQVAELLSWRAGFIVFHETTLAEAVAEFNRYNTTQVELQDPALAQLRISGNFRATNIDSFTQLLEGGYLVSVERQDGRIVLSRR